LEALSLGIWVVVALSVAGLILRPFGWPEAVWAVGGAILLVIAGLLPAKAALHGVAEGTDVYLFLTGMMLLSELARREGLFDWLAAHVARRAGGSARKLFLLVYLMGTVVTVFLSNDATAVVLTPAVAAVVRAAGAKTPLPFLLICAFIANAASFVLPISNPANLVIYGAHIPPLLHWLPLYALPSLASILVTFAVLRFTQRAALREAVGTADAPPLSRGGALAAAGIAGTAILLLAVSGVGVSLGLPTFLAGCATAALVLIPQRQLPWPVLKDISWSVLPLVAGLFVLVAGLDASGLTAALSATLRRAAAAAPAQTAWAAGLLLGFGCNLVNNLPAGLIAGHAVQAAQVSEKIRAAVLIGVDLGPNLSVTGSLATILWLAALRREKLHVNAWTFLKLGIAIMPAALLCALAGVFVTGAAPPG
jgi:arsenical pump membrane protein